MKDDIPNDNSSNVKIMRDIMKLQPIYKKMFLNDRN